jgi:hypothetical protein
VPGSSLVKYLNYQTENDIDNIAQNSSYMDVGFIGPLEHCDKPQVRVRNVNMQLKYYTSYCRENKMDSCNILVVVFF